MTKVPHGWSNASKTRRGLSTQRTDSACWGCGVLGCTECGPDPDAPDVRTGFAVADDAPGD